MPPATNQVELSLVIPAYNEVESLAILHDKITSVLDELGMRWEVVYIDDGSTDGTLGALRKLRTTDERVIVAVQRRNFGKSQALNVGFALAHGQILITMDADLQDEPAEIPRLIEKLDEGYDVVIGWKKERQDPLSKTIPSRIANTTMAWATGLKIHDMNSGLKAYRAECVRRIQVYGDLHRYIPVIAHYNGFRVAEIPVKHHPRQYGTSKYGPGRLLRGGFDLMTVVFLHTYRYRPLHLFGGTGFALAFAGFVINAYLSIEWLRGMRPIGDRPLLTLGVLMMVVGLQLLTMGLLAELLVSYTQRNEDPLRTTAAILTRDDPTAAAPDRDE